MQNAQNDEIWRAAQNRRTEDLSRWLSDRAGGLLPRPKLALNLERGMAIAIVAVAAINTVSAVIHRRKMMRICRGSTGAAVACAIYHYTLIKNRERMPCFAAFKHNNWLGGVLFAGIAALLHPGAEIRAGSFADSPDADGSFDLAIGNVPFGNMMLRDRRHSPARHSIHNHFIVKALHLVRPGGLAVVLTSRFGPRRAVTANNAWACMDKVTCQYQAW